MPLSAAIPSPAPPTMDELRALELRCDGPIPPHALADARSCPPQPLALARLGDAELQRWAALADANLKAEQRRLSERRAKVLAVRSALTIDPSAKNYALGLARSEAQWSLTQCVAARLEAGVFRREMQRRACAAQHLRPQVRTLQALNRALGLGGAL